MTRLRVLLSGICVLLSFCSGAQAYADTFTFQVQGSLYSGSGTLTATPDATIAGAFDVTGISGLLNGMTITGLLPCATFNPSAPCGSSSLSFDYDNVLYPSGLPPFDIVELDADGLGFLIGNQALDIAATSSHVTTLFYNGEPADATPINVTFTVSPTPEPGSFLLLGTGFLGMVSAVRRRVRA